MSARRKIVLSWSGGKDSALALHALRQAGTWEVVALLTTVAEPYGRISHHGVRAELLRAQAEALGEALHVISLPDPCSNVLYEEAMGRAMRAYREAGVEAVAFGDIFLQDLRDYRERNLAPVGLGAEFPLWGQPTGPLLQRFLALGFRGVLACVDGAKLTRDFAGRAIDTALLADLPRGVDPCGENGEYHSFVWDGPIFKRPVPVRVGEIVQRDTRFFADLLPAAGPGASDA
ncbi:MAG: adenine nucleotide alpha hydrolase [Candidatus Lambdaproteobacteria bacterium]|nr:adenine nucleotide alpha hydrolase [Candidatus Lambdaproteobacteria bacterium]